MSKTFMRGLELLEIVDLHGPLTVTELARRSGAEKSIVSRMIAACEADGWVVRTRGQLQLGTRAALLGHSSAAAVVVRAAEPLVHAVAGVTGLLTQVYGLAGRRAVVLASAGGRQTGSPTGLGVGVPLFATAAGKMVAAQLDGAELDRLLPPERFPDAVEEMAGLAGYPQLANAVFSGQPPALAGTTGIARDRRQLAQQLRAIRRAGRAIDIGEFHPELGCLAVPWPRPELPAAFACMGSPAELRAADELVTTALAVASAPGASPEGIVASAAAVIERDVRGLAAGPSARTRRGTRKR